MSRKRGRSRGPCAKHSACTLIWGVNPVDEFLAHAAESFLEILVLPSFGRKKRQRSLLARAERCAVPVRSTADFNRLKLADRAVHQGIAARVRPIWNISLNDLPEAWGTECPLIVVCDEISDPGNLGAIIRSSAAFGVHVVMISERNSADINGTVIKASAGTLIHIRVCRIRNTVNAIDALKASGIWTACLAVRESRPVWDEDLKVPLALVLGAEGRGLRPLVMKHCDMSLHIPQAPGVESMNVAAACTAALYETARQRTVFT